MCFKQLLRFVVIVLCFGDLKCDYNFFVSKQYNEGKYYCVTNTSFALTWVHKDKQETSVSSYIPTIREKFHCDFEQNDWTYCDRFYTRTKWKLSNSLDENINEVILDQRWEDLETIQTEFSTGQLKYKPVLTTLKEDFEIPFSLRSDRESHIFLCDGPYPPKANCYWFMLQAWNGEASAIRKCTKDFIPITSTELPKKPCSTPLIRIQHPGVPFYLSSDYWSHLKIVKKRNNLSLIQASNEKKILEWTENSTLINVTHMIIHNKMVTAFWKIHKIEFIYTEEIFTDAHFGPPINPFNGSLCISMFLLMCKSCQLKLTLKTYNRYTIIAEQVYKNSHTGWSEIKFVADRIVQDTRIYFYFILISTIGGNEESFWAIDKVRQCQNQEFRMISTNTKAPCQLMSKKHNAISFDNNSKLEIVVNDNCSKDTIGEFCVPCNWIYDKCEKISICSKDEETKKQRCYCSAGYQNYGECYYECETGRYGHGCTKYCGNCGTQCNVIDGKCPGSCFHYYFTGPKCDIVSTAVFAKSPEITNIEYTEATVQVNSFQLQNSTEDEPISYTIQIKPAEKNKFWADVESNIKFNKSKPVTITNLKPDSTYFVRGIINIKNRNESYNGDQIPIQNFTTKCEDINKNNLKIIPFKNSVQIITPKDMRFICETIIDFKNQKSNFTNNTIFEDLEPFTDYTIEIQTGSRSAKSYSNKISFRTTEGTPTAVQNLRAIDNTITSSSITLKWNHPRHVYGYLQNYVIEYKHLNYKNCRKEPSTSSISQRTNNTFIAIDGLIPFSVYSFKVYARNNKFNGMPDTISVQTQALEYISEEEIPNIAIETGTTEAIIKFSESDECKGPLNVMCTLTCHSEWCQNITIPSAKLPKDELALRNLRPYSNYSLTMRFCRNDNLCSKTMRRDQFQTEPSVPNSIRDLSVYSKSETTISLRWRPPHPPTGYLEDYKIEFFYKWLFKIYSSETIAHKNACKLWPKFHCVKLSNLEENREYTIKVYTKNKVPNKYGNSEEIVATTTTEKSEAPSNLKFTWTMQNDLEVKWTHPIRSNGVIQYFQITLDNHLPQNKLTKQYHLTEETYQRNYTYTINATDLQPTTKYTVTVTAFNGYLGENATNITDESPPDIPSFKGTPQIFSATNTTITVNIEAAKPRDTQKTDYLLFLLISDKDSDLKTYPELKTYILTNMRLVCKMRIENFDQKHSFTIGNQSDVCNGSHNPPLEPQTFYNITVILTNSFRNKARYIVFSNMVNTTGKYVMSETFNGYLGEDANVTDESPPDIPSFKETPQFFNATYTTITVNIEAEKPRDTQKTDYLLFLLISDKDSNLKTYPELKTFILTNMRLVCKMRIENFNQKHSFTIGYNNQSDSCDGQGTTQNPPLQHSTLYNITIVLVNTFQGKSRYVIYSHMYATRRKENLKLLFLLLLLAVIPLVVIALLRYKNKHQRKDYAKHQMPDHEIPLHSVENVEHSKVVTYENTGTTSNIFSKKILVQDFHAYVKKSEVNGEFDHQHATILVNPARKIYDTTLGCQYFDYIDMEYINGSKVTKAYIAAETPSQLAEINDFWKAIWDENVKHILLFDNAENHTFEKYWPENTAIMICHGISLQVAFSEDFPNYKCRKFILIFEKEIRHVDQIHFRNCEHNPEKYVSLFKKLSKFPLNSISPIYVHSSAGIGGTGFILLCDMSLRMAAEEDAVDVLRNLQRLSDHNSDLVDDLQQYKLAHNVISQYLARQKRL